VKAAVQRDAAECIQQLALFPPAREALQADSSLLEAVQALAESGWTDEAKDSASRTLAIVNPEQIKRTVVDQQSLHIMMSCKRVFVCCLDAVDPCRHLTTRLLRLFLSRRPMG
jgi:hypothetical protein